MYFENHGLTRKITHRNWLLTHISKFILYIYTYSASKRIESPNSKTMQKDSKIKLGSKPWTQKSKVLERQEVYASSNIKNSLVVVGLNFERTQVGAEHSSKKAAAIEVDLDFDSSFAIFEGDLAILSKLSVEALNMYHGLGL